MRHVIRIGLFAVGATALTAWACNVQPKTESGPASSSPEPRLTPEPGVHTGNTARSPVSEPARPRADRRYVHKLAKIPPPPKGPQDKAPKPLPKADKVIAVFHSGNMEGELDPCG